MARRLWTVALLVAVTRGAVLSPKRRRELHHEAVRKFEESAERERERERVERQLAWLETALDHVLARSHAPMRALSAHDQLRCGCELDSLRPIAYGAARGAECVRADESGAPGWDEGCGTVCLHASGRQIVQFCPRGLVQNCTAGCVRAPVERLEQRAAAVEARGLGARGARAFEREGGLVTRPRPLSALARRRTSSASCSSRTP